MATTKVCFKCGRRRAITMFYRHPQMSDGRLNKCKDCTKKDVSANYRVNREHYAEYERKRYKDPKRREACRVAQRIRRSRHPGRYKAHYAVSNAVRDGRLIRMPCVVCGDVKSQAHHDDYRKPLDVRWLCRKHHLENHGKQAY